MTIEAKVICDSCWHADLSDRLITLQLRYPRFIHAEFMTHRALSRNASSSRAIPTDKIISAIELDPAMPAEWGKNKRGMQSAGSVDDQAAEQAQVEWLDACREAVARARKLQALGLHKQVVNRLLEPFAHISVVATGLGVAWKHFLRLRNHSAADPTFQALAREVQVAIEGHEPQVLLTGQWHLPYVDGQPEGEISIAGATWELGPVLSAARCARVSYNNHDGQAPTHEEDFGLFAKLIGDPPHASPFEHQACVAGTWDAEPGNFRMPDERQTWQQFRKSIPGEGYGLA